MPYGIISKYESRRQLMKDSNMIVNTETMLAKHHVRTCWKKEWSSIKLSDGIIIQHTRDPRSNPLYCT